MDLAVGRQPTVSDLQQQQGLAPDQAQHIAQVVAIERGQRASPALALAVHQQGGVGRYRIAVHQPQLALGVLARVDLLLELAKQRTAVQIVVPHQVGRAHEGAAGHLFTQGQLDVRTGLPGQR